MNAAFEQLVGRTAEALLALSVSDITHPDDLLSADGALAQHNLHAPSGADIICWSDAHDGRANQLLTAGGFSPVNCRTY